jgi:hypothetical protein
MLYEAIKERGSMVIVPSSVVETMGLSGTRATAALEAERKPNRVPESFSMPPAVALLYSWNLEPPLGRAAPTFIDRCSKRRERYG